VPFIRAGLDADEPAIAAVPAENLDLVRRALGGDRDHVELQDMAVAGRNPARIIPQVLLAFAAVHDGRPVRIIGEPIWHGRTVRRMNPAWLDDAYRTHPEVSTGSAGCEVQAT
jgi:hypothetical protein